MSTLPPIFSREWQRRRQQVALGVITPRALALSYRVDLDAIRAWLYPPPRRRGETRRRRPRPGDSS